jgi:hypothetical protein
MSQPEDETPADEDADENSKQLEFTDTFEIEASKDRLWSVISDPETLTECVPGAESIERESEREYTLEITREISHITVALTGEAEFVEMNPPDYIVTKGHAYDTKTGSDFEVLAAMEMNEIDDETVALTYQAEVSFTGGVASITNAILRPVINRDVETYFENVKSIVEAGDGS